MGTNYYLVEGKRHIGKRSAAGLYCWDCGVTLCKGGIEHVHHSNHYSNDDWYEECPLCGKKYDKESMFESAVGRELGFNTSKPRRKTGVKSCSSFTWAIDPKIIDELKRGKPIKNEYGEKFTKKQFLKLLEECPIKYFDNIGQTFS